MRPLLALLVLIITVISCKDTSQNNVIVTEEPTFTKENSGQIVKALTGVTLLELDIEIADDEYQRQTGLMYRNSMTNSQGMLFVFPDEKLRSFYMKNTRISLDLLFLDSNFTIVDFQKNAQPMSEASLPSKVAAQYVLEINGGLSDTLMLQIGDTLILEETL